MKTKTVILIVFAIFSGIVTFSQNLEEGLIAYYPFSGNAEDASGNGYNGLITGATFTEDHNGNSNSAIQFADASQMVDLQNTDAFSFGQGSFSISYWFNTSATNIYMAAFINGCGAWYPGIVSGLNWETGRIIFGVGTEDGMFDSDNVIGVCTNDDTWNDGQWHHVVSIVNKEDNKAMIYVDGEKQALVKYNVFGVTGGTLINNDTELDITGVEYLADASEATTLIGNSAYGQFFNGAIDEFRVYDRALTEQEVNLLYTGSAAVGKTILSANFLIYPNPVSNNIYFDLKAEEISRIEILDMFGRLILKQQNLSKNSLHQIDISELSSGLYLLNIYSNEKIYVHKFQKK